MTMNLQYISDSSGKTTGVFIPIEEWQALKARYRGIDQEEVSIPESQQKEVKKRLEDYHNNPSGARDFDEFIKEVDQEL